MLKKSEPIQSTSTGNDTTSDDSDLIDVVRANQLQLQSASSVITALYAHAKVDLNSRTAEVPLGLFLELMRFQ